MWPSSRRFCDLNNGAAVELAMIDCRRTRSP
jgi:hypothetical protein